MAYKEFDPEKGLYTEIKVDIDKGEAEIRKTAFPDPALEKLKNIRKIDEGWLGKKNMHKIGFIPYAVIEVSPDLQKALAIGDMEYIREWLRRHPEFKTTNKKI